MQINTACFLLCVHSYKCNSITRKSTQTIIKKNLELSVLVGTAIKALEQAAEMKHELSACMHLIPALAVLYTRDKCMHLVCVSYQLLVSMLLLQSLLILKISYLFTYITVHMCFLTDL